MSTPYNSALQGQIAETVLLLGDPLRAKFIVETFLEDAEQFNTVRNMFGYTGNYKGKKISVMGTGMGCPSIGIYSYELISHFGVKNLVRIGSCGAFSEDLELFDIVIGMGSSTNSNFATQYHLPGTLSAGSAPRRPGPASARQSPIRPPPAARKAPGRSCRPVRRAKPYR